MDNKRTAELDYKAKCEHLNKELCKMREALDIANFKTTDQSRTIAYLEGQIRAFEFCIAGGNNNA